MRAKQEAQSSFPNTRTLTIVAQDPSVKVGGRILTADVDVPAEKLALGPRGYRVSVIDYDVSNNTLYEPAEILPPDETKPGQRNDAAILGDPRFHAQNVYAIVMRTLGRFESALGRRVAWGSDGHQIHIAPHAFAEANAFYSRADRAILFGYFASSDNRPVFTCLSHDVVAHETTHAILDGLRGRYLEPSSPDQAAFHEGFADIIALLSVFSLKDIVGALLDRKSGKGSKNLIDAAHLTRDELEKSVLLGLADEMGEELTKVRGEALRRSVKLTPGKPYATMAEFQEPHARGELVVAATMNAFLDIWLARLKKVGFIEGKKRDRDMVVDEGAQVAGHLLTMAIRAIDYCPPTDITFADYLSALLTIDREVVPDDKKYNYRKALLDNFAKFDIKPAANADAEGIWRRFEKPLVYKRVRFDSLLRDKEEVFRFIWENRETLNIHKDGYVEVESVQPSFRVGPDGFILHETVAEYVQILTLKAGELKSTLGIEPPPSIPNWKRLRIFGGGVLIFDEYGQLKYQVANDLAKTKEDIRRQTERLKYLSGVGFFDAPTDTQSHFAAVHLARAMS